MIKYFQLGFIIFLVLLNIISTFLFTNRISDYFFKSLISCSVHSPILNIKIKVNGDKSILNNLGHIIISNHQNATDLIIINYLFDKINCVCKSNIICDEDLPIYFRFIKYIEKTFFKSFRFIPYERGNKENGEVVKKTMKEIIERNKNVLVFPEGHTTKSGIPQDFKNGLFRNASENSIPVIPISLKYNKPVGINKEDKIDPFVWFNYEVEVFIHPIQTNKNWEKLKQDCLKLVREPILEKKDN